MPEFAELRKFLANLGHLGREDVDTAVERAQRDAGPAGEPAGSAPEAPAGAVVGNDVSAALGQLKNDVSAAWAGARARMAQQAQGLEAEGKKLLVDVIAELDMAFGRLTGADYGQVPGLQSDTVAGTIPVAPPPEAQPGQGYPGPSQPGDRVQADAPAGAPLRGGRPPAEQEGWAGQQAGAQPGEAQEGGDAPAGQEDGPEGTPEAESAETPAEGGGDGGKD
jgi:hypothetical protein